MFMQTMICTNVNCVNVFSCTKYEVYKVKGIRMWYWKYICICTMIDSEQRYWTGVYGEINVVFAAFFLNSSSLCGFCVWWVTLHSQKILNNWNCFITPQVQRKTCQFMILKHFSHLQHWLCEYEKTDIIKEYDVPSDGISVDVTVKGDFQS